MLGRIRWLFRKNREVLEPTVEIIKDARVNDDRVLVEAVRAGEKMFVRYLLDRGANVDATDDRGNTPLNIAAHNGMMELVREFLGRGAKIDTPNHDGNTPLLWAAHQGHRDIVALLADKGANVDHANEEGNSPLIMAMVMGRKEVVQYLVDMDADVTHTNKKGVSALSIAESVKENGGSQGIADIVLRARGFARPVAALVEMPLAIQLRS